MVNVADKKLNNPQLKNIMRLTQTEIKAIQQSFNKIFNKGKIFLFGSRINDNIKGGDIDLYIIANDSHDLRRKKINFLIELKSRIGEQKIDVLLSTNKTKIIEQEALKTGILL